MKALIKMGVGYVDGEEEGGGAGYDKAEGMWDTAL